MRRYFVMSVMCLATGCSSESAAPPVPTQVDIAAPADTIKVFGGSVQLAARVLDQSGKELAGVPVSWTGSNPAIIEVTSSGLATAKEAGSITITAQAGAARATRSLYANFGPPSITTATATVQKTSLNGETITLTLENKGNGGSFKIQAWGGRAPNVPNAPAVMMAETEGASVAAGWKETVAYVLTTNRSTIQTEFVVILSSNPGSVTYRETARINVTRL